MFTNTANCAEAEAAKLSNPSKPRFGNTRMRFSVITQFELICMLWHSKKPGYLTPFVHSSFTDWAHSALGAQRGWVTKEACLQGHKLQVPLRVTSKQTWDCTALSQLLLSVFWQDLQQPDLGG